MTWIKVRTNLHEDPRVLCVATILGVPVSQTVGMLVRLWSYADSHSTDGLLRMISAARIDEIVGCEGFCSALQSVGWMEFQKGGCSLPRFDQHNGSTAKTRAQATRAVQRHRFRKASSGDGEPLPEERRGEEKREEKREEKKSPRARGENGGKAWM